MPFVVFIPCVLCIAALFRGGTRLAFLAVLLPVLMILPTNFNLAIKPLPPLSFLDATLFPLGIGMVLMDFPRWRFSRMDCWVALFLFTAVYAQYKPYGLKGAIPQIFSLALEGLVPYMAGKLLAEQPGTRTEAVKRLVIWMAIASLLSMPEYYFKTNPYIHFWSHFFPGQWPEMTQIRWGFGRVGGPYGGSESAGMVLLIGLPLALWLQHCNYQRPNAAGYLKPVFKYSGFAIFIIVATLLMAQARGPWIGTIAALGIASIGRARRPLRQAVLVFGLGLLVGVPLYIVGKDYVSGPRTDFGSERDTAQYRAQLIDNYVPIAKLGGAWGWGIIYPVVDGQFSIDNEFLFAWLVQGYIGLTSLILILMEAIASFVRSGMKSRLHQERYFVYSMLGILLGLAIALATVWLNSQSYELFFLIIGWSQAIRPAEIGAPRLREEKVKHELPRAADMHVYT